MIEGSEFIRKVKRIAPALNPESWEQRVAVSRQPIITL
jgi:hypothetical protein